MSYQSAPEPALVVQHTGQVFPMGQAPITIGRQENNTIVLSDRQVSRQHAVIFWRAGAYYVEDQGSANGTYLDERPISGPELLTPGSVLRVGGTKFDVQVPPVGESTLVDRGVRRGPSAAAPAAAAASAPPSSSALPLIVGILIAGIVVVGLAIGAILLLSGGWGGTPTVAIQAPAPGAQLAGGEPVVLLASARGSDDITRLELSVDGTVVAMVASPDSAGAPSLTVDQQWSFTQAGSHTISGVAYTARGKVSDPTTINVVVASSVAQQTPAATAEASQVPAQQPSDTPLPSVAPPTVPAPTATMTASLPTSEPTASSEPTATPSRTPTATPTPTTQPAPEIEYFRASPTTITAGGCTTLEWGTVTGASSATIDQDIGGVATPSSRNVCPAETTTYVLTAVGPGGTTTASATVTVQAAQPDLIVASIAFVPAPPVQGQDNEVQITIQNVGSGAAGPFHWEWQPGSTPPLGGHLPGGLNAGGTTVVTTVWRPNNPYTSLSTVARVDIHNAVAESNEDNNELQVNVQVVESTPVNANLAVQPALDGFRANNGGGNDGVEIRVGNGTMVGSPTFELVARGFLSFDLSGIPSGADILNVELRFYQVQIQGDPYGKLGSLQLKHVDCGSSLDAADYDTTAMGSADLATHTAPDTWYTITSETIAAWIEQDLAAGRSRLQMRLQFSPETDGDGLEDYAQFESGDNSLGTGNVPSLAVTYRP